MKYRVMAPTFIKFDQAELVDDYKKGKWHLSQGGVCLGLCVDFFRFYQKRNKRIQAGKITSAEMQQDSFLYKEGLRQYLDISFIVKSGSTKPNKEEKSFARRVQFYQLFQYGHNPITQGKIEDFQSFRDTIEGNSLKPLKDYLEITVSGPKGAHAISIATLRDEKGKVLEYRLLEPGSGEHRNIKTIDELDKVFKDLMKKSTYTDFSVADYEEIFQGYDLANNKRMFYSLDKMHDPKSLKKEELIDIFQSLFQAKVALVDICDLIPQDPKVMRYILENTNELLINSSDSVYSILEFAVRNKDKDGGRDLLTDLLANPQIYISKDKNDLTVLHWAISEGNHKLVEILVERMTPAQLVMKNNDEDTALHMAVGKGQISEALVLKMSQNSQLAEQDKKGYTALHLAIKLNHTEIAKMLIQNMSAKDLAIKDNMLKYTALEWALARDNTEIATMLVKKMKPDQLAVKNKNGKTLLHVAIEKGHIEIARALVEKMRAKDIEDSKGDIIPLLRNKIDELEGESNKSMSIKNRRIEAFSKIRDLILTKKPPLHAVLDSQKITDEMHKELRKLIAAGVVDINDRGDMGNTALHVAAGRGHDSTVKELIQLGANLGEQNNFGDTPLDVAKKGTKAKTILFTHQFLEENQRLDNDPTKFIDKVAEIKQQDALDKDMIAKYLSEPISVRSGRDSGALSEEDEGHGYMSVSSDDERPNTPGSDSGFEDRKPLKTRLQIILEAQPKDGEDRAKIETRKKIAMQYCAPVSSAQTETLPSQFFQQTSKSRVK